jgi:NAD(P)-dependent dehydrogenase (short-subunit alcohol dehydrogenase family)
MAFGPAEAFTPEQFAQLYDVNVLGTQRVNRAALPQLRKQGRGLVIWVSSSSTRGGTPPYLAPYFAAKAAMDSLAVSYAGELARWGVETTIVVPGAFTKGTSHFAKAGSPADQADLVSRPRAENRLCVWRNKFVRGAAQKKPIPSPNQRRNHHGKQPTQYEQYVGATVANPAF